MKKLNILGVEYKIIIADENEKPKLKDCDGYFDFSVKEIVVGKFEADDRSVENLEAYTRKVIRHEIVHAFLYESGLWENSGTADSWGQDETITDWIAIQAPKLFNAFQEADAL